MGDPSRSETQAQLVERFRLLHAGGCFAGLADAVSFEELNELFSDAAT